MSKRWKIITLILLLILLVSIGIGIAISKNKDDDNEINIGNYIAEEKVEDECTEEYKEQQNLTTVSSTEEKVSANSIMVLKKYYKACEHTLNEYVELPQELVNMTKEQVQAQYPDWEIIGFSPEQLILYKEFEGECGEHFRLKVEDGKVVIYLVQPDGSQTLYEKTNISSEYLTETDLLNMQGDGLEIFGKEELNMIIEDFE